MGHSLQSISRETNVNWKNYHIYGWLILLHLCWIELLQLRVIQFALRGYKTPCLNSWDKTPDYLCFARRFGCFHLFCAQFLSSFFLIHFFWFLHTPVPPSKWSTSCMVENIYWLKYLFINDLLLKISLSIWNITT